MDGKDLMQLLQNVADGNITPQTAALKLKGQPFTDLGYAKPDMHRGI